MLCRVGANLVFALFLCDVRTRKSMTNYELRTQMDANGRSTYHVPGMTIDN